MNKEDIVNLAFQRVDMLLSEHAGSINGDEVIVPVIGQQKLVLKLAELEPEYCYEFIYIAVDVLRQFEIISPNFKRVNNNLNSSIDGLGLVSRSALVGLAAAAIGASAGLIGEDIHPILVGIVGAESAVAFNVLSALLTDHKCRENSVDGLDLAVLSVLQKGHYTTEEVKLRISENLNIDEVRASICKLKRLHRIKDGRWSGTYTIVEVMPI